MQKRIVSIGIVSFFLLVLFFAGGCGENKGATQAPVVSKKIATKPQKTPPPKPDPVKNEPNPAAKQETAVKDEVGEKVASTRIYDPKQRINPFIPLFGNTGGSDGVKASKKRRRVPQTPLERISLDQLKLKAIIRASSGNRALVEDTVGKGYIIKNGTYIGLNAGMVTQINVDSVIVEEEVENFKGEMVLQNTEMKLQKPTGE